MDTDWIKAAAAQVRTTIRQAINKVDRIGNSRAEHPARQASDDVLEAKIASEVKEAGAANK